MLALPGSAPSCSRINSVTTGSRCYHPRASSTRECGTSTDDANLHRSRHRSPERTRARPAPAGHVHRHQPAESPRARGGRQQRRRGAGRALQPHLGHRLQGRLDRSDRRRPRHAGRHPPEGEGERRRADPHAPARGRQIRRQDLQVLRRPARRGRVRGERALEAPRVLGAARRQGIQHLVQGRQGPLEARGRRRGRQGQHRHHGALLARSHRTSTRPRSRCRS